MKKLKLIACAAAVVTACSPAAAQGIDAAMRQIERNNTTLRALAGEAAARKAEARADIALPDPEVEYARLWGTPAAVGNRTDVAVSQGFDIATLGGMKLRQARRRADVAELWFLSERTAILLEAKEYCIELVHRNRLAATLDGRLRHAELLVESYRRKLDAGEANALEFNRARMNLAGVQAEAARNGIERDGLRAELRRMNGGEGDVALTDTDFPAVEEPLPTPFNVLHRGMGLPQLCYADGQAFVDSMEVRLARVEALPRFSVGYMRERTAGQYYQGVKVGVSIPLWAGRGRVRAARAARDASRVRVEDAAVQYTAQVQRLYDRAVALRELAAERRRVLAEYGGAELSEKALEAGEISLPEYIVELGLLYDAETLTLEAERDFCLALAALTAVEL